MVQMPLIAAGLTIGRESTIGGLGGLAIALILSASVNTLLNLFLVRQLVASSLREQLALAARPMIASAGMFGVLTVVGRYLAARSGETATILHLAALVGAGAMVFGTFLFILHTVFAGPDSAERELTKIVQSRLHKFGVSK